MADPFIFDPATGVYKKLPCDRYPDDEDVEFPDFDPDSFESKDFYLTGAPTQSYKGDNIMSVNDYAALMIMRFAAWAVTMAWVSFSVFPWIEIFIKAAK